MGILCASGRTLSFCSAHWFNLFWLPVHLLYGSFCTRSLRRVFFPVASHGLHMPRQVDRQTDRQTDRQDGICTGGPLSPFVPHIGLIFFGLPVHLLYGSFCTRSLRRVFFPVASHGLHMPRQVDRQTDRQTDRQDGICTGGPSRTAMDTTIYRYT